MAYQRPPRTALDGRTFFLRLLLHNFVYTSTTLRRSVFDEVGVYDETLSTGEDWDLWLRIAHRGTPPVRAPGLLAIHRDHRSSLATDTRTMIANICEVYRRFAEDQGEDHEVRALASGQLDYWTRRLRALEEPTPRVRVRSRLGAIKRRLLNRWLWPGRRPDPVERTLRLVGELE